MPELDPTFLALPLDRLSEVALETMASTPGLDYGDLRIHRDLVQGIHVREGDLIALTDSEPLGFGIRLIVEGSFGFAASSELSEKGVLGAIKAAAQMARALKPLLPEQVALAAEPAHQESWVGPYEQSPFAVPATEKVALMIEATSAALAAGAKFSEFYCLQVQENRLFVSTEGSRILQERVRMYPIFEVGMLDEQGSGLVETMRS
ncbi:MAG: PmbA/TldA family metallopeptidase, partial [Candidatus Dormibacteria bacterium]